MSPKSNGVLYPMSQIQAGKDRLENFVWFDYIRPLNKADIFNWRGKRVEDQLKKNVRGPVVLPNARSFCRMPDCLKIRRRNNIWECLQ